MRPVRVASCLILVATLAVVAPAGAKLDVPRDYYPFLEPGTQVSLKVKNVEGPWVLGGIALEVGDVVTFTLGGFTQAEQVIPNAPSQWSPAGNVSVTNVQQHLKSFVQNWTSRHLGEELSLVIGNWTGGFLAPNDWNVNFAWCNASRGPNATPLVVTDNGHSISFEDNPTYQGNHTKLVYERATGKLLRAQVDRHAQGGQRGLVLERVDAKSPGLVQVALLTIAGGLGTAVVVWALKRNGSGERK
ncbi:MAG: hypothetical protein Kow0069_19170 [Promethearchaeota archaeon]